MKRRAALSSSQTVARKKPRRALAQTSVIYKSPSFVARELDPRDYKVADYLVNGANTTTAGNIYPILTNLVPGTDYLNNFTGQKINPVGIQLNWETVCGDPTNLMRLVLFQWFDSASPAVSGVLQGNCLSPVAINNRENIKVLRDELVCMALPEPTGNAIACGKWYVKGKRIMPAMYNASSGSWQKGNLFLLVVSDSGLVPNPTVSFYSRVTFLDA